ncbi:MAG: hypothetical protein EBY09_13340 [Verrucomicrobia bacterium]|nr:hypothetical protein [Verrucomicrobiota bacterium]
MVYQRPEAFSQPALRGAVGFRLDGERVVVTVAELLNPRDAANVSGTLALELRGYSWPYSGGNDEGTLLAGVTLGTLAGQTSLMDSSFDLLFNRPSAGVWNFALLLREWTAGGYVTRDFINFDLPVQFEAPVQPAPVVIAPVALPEVQPVVAVTSAVTEVAPQPSARIQVEAPVEKAPVVVPVAKAAVAAPASPAKAVAQPPAAKPTVVSVNAAGVDELAAVKGMPRKVAEGIVKRRPFKSLDDLTKIKGMGVKLLEKLRVHLKL